MATPMRWVYPQPPTSAAERRVSRSKSTVRGSRWRAGGRRKKKEKAFWNREGWAGTVSGYAIGSGGMPSEALTPPAPLSQGERGEKDEEPCASSFSPPLPWGEEG